MISQTFPCVSIILSPSTSGKNSGINVKKTLILLIGLIDFSILWKKNDSLMKWECMDVLIKADLAPVCWRPAQSRELSAVTSHLGKSPNPQVACSSFLSSAPTGYTAAASVIRRSSEWTWL